MIDFFLKNEAVINLVCFSVFLITMLVPDVFNKYVSKLMGLLFIVAFSTCFLSVLLNGMVKGF